MKISNIKEEYKKIAVVIPTFKAIDSILGVIAKIGNEVDNIYVVDDYCPQNSGQFVINNCTDSRVVVIKNEINLGVGGATIAGFKRAIFDGCDIIIKIDSDGQMNPALIPIFIKPILQGKADYTKGNRFFNPEDVIDMPIVRLIGNAGLSFLTKLSSGYWNIFDPTNGFVAINAKLASVLPLDKLHKRYFFESDMLFRLNLARAVVCDIPMKAIYGNEVSSLSPHRELPRFFLMNIKNASKRVFYNYFLRDFNLASLNLLFGFCLSLGGLFFGIYEWVFSIRSNVPATSGTVMFAAMPIFIGFTMLLNFFSYDFSNTPKYAISGLLGE
jgi:dolichol-phosphate mannosyltransferase